MLNNKFLILGILDLSKVLGLKTGLFLDQEKLLTELTTPISEKF